MPLKIVFCFDDLLGAFHCFFYVSRLELTSVKCYPSTWSQSSQLKMAAAPDPIAEAVGPILLSLMDLIGIL